MNKIVSCEKCRNYIFLIYTYACTQLLFKQLHGHSQLPTTIMVTVIVTAIAGYIACSAYYPSSFHPSSAAGCYTAALCATSHSVIKIDFLDYRATIIIVMEANTSCNSLFNMFLKYFLFDILLFVLLSSI